MLNRLFDDPEIHLLDIIFLEICVYLMNIRFTVDKLSTTAMSIDSSFYIC